MPYMRMGGGSSPEPQKLIVFDGTYKNPDISFSWSVPTGEIGIYSDYSPSAYTLRSYNWSSYPTAVCTTDIELLNYKSIRVHVNSNNTNYNVEIGYNDSSNTWHQIQYLQRGLEYNIDVSNISGKLAFRQVYFAFWMPILELTPIDSKYLYKDGKQNVDWDNSSDYNISGDYPSSHIPYLMGNGYIETPELSSNSTSSVLVTNNIVDISEYSKLKLTYDGINTITLDISSINASGYILLATYRNSNVYYRQLFITSQKDYGYNYKYAFINLDYAVSTPSIKINRIWLEK